MSKLPILGEYFVFTLNPAETLARIHDDPVVAEACKKLQAKCKRYIGCCVAWCTIPVLGSLAPIKISLVSRGLVAQPDGVISADMSLPISPTTYHPRNRKPLIVDPPLPWDDCYHLTLSEMTARVRYSEWSSRPRGKYALLPRGQTAILDGYQEDDEEWKAKIKYMQETGGTDFEPDPLQDPEAMERYYDEVRSEPDSVPINAGVLSPFSEDPRNGPDGAQDSESETYSDEEELTDPSIHSVAADSEREIKFVPHLANFDYAAALDITLDLETVPSDELAANVYDFYAELRELGQIMISYADRTQALRDEVRRQDAELDAKVSRARQSRADDESTQSILHNDNDTPDDLAPRTNREIEGPALSESGVASPADDHPDDNSTLPVRHLVTANDTLPTATPTAAATSVSSMMKGNGTTSAPTSPTPKGISPSVPRSGRLQRTVRCLSNKCGRLVEASRKAGSRIKARFSLSRK